MKRLLDMVGMSVGGWLRWTAGAAICLGLGLDDAVALQVRMHLEASGRLRGAQGR